MEQKVLEVELELNDIIALTRGIRRRIEDVDGSEGKEAKEAIGDIMRLANMAVEKLYRLYNALDLAGFPSLKG